MRYNFIILLFVHLLYIILLFKPFLHSKNCLFNLLINKIFENKFVIILLLFWHCYIISFILTIIPFTTFILLFYNYTLILINNKLFILCFPYGNLIFSVNYKDRMFSFNFYLI